VQNIHAYLHEVVGALQQINSNRGTENNNQNNFDTNGNLLNLNNIGNLEWHYNNTLNKLTKSDKSNATQYYVAVPP
jgi:insecticidal toxin complex protein TccC